MERSEAKNGIIVNGEKCKQDCSGTIVNIEKGLQWGFYDNNYYYVNYIVNNGSQCWGKNMWNSSK